VPAARIGGLAKEEALAASRGGISSS